MTVSVSSVGKRRGRTWRSLGAFRSDPAARCGLLVAVLVLPLLPLAPIHAVERDDLLEVGVTLGQGYLTGRPKRLLELWPRPKSSPPDRGALPGPLARPLTRRP